MYKVEEAYEAEEEKEVNFAKEEEETDEPKEEEEEKYPDEVSSWKPSFVEVTCKGERALFTIEPKFYRSWRRKRALLPDLMIVLGRLVPFGTLVDWRNIQWSSKINNIMQPI